MRWADGREMTTAEKIRWWSKLLSQSGGVLIWLGIVLLISIPILIGLVSH